jgi:hypothetical protein
MGRTDKIAKQIEEKKMVQKSLTNRWCPTHRRYETNPPGLLRCSVAWREQYALEDEIKAQGVGTANAVLQIAAQLERFTDALLDIFPPGVQPRAITAPGPRPPQERPPAPKPQPSSKLLDVPL